MNDDSTTRTIQSVTNSTKIINALQDIQMGTITQLSEMTGLSPASVHAHLSTLQEAGYVVQTEQQYRLGAGLIELGEHVRNHSVLYQASKEEIDELAEKTEECVHLHIEHQGKLVALYERFGSEGVGTDYYDRMREEVLNYLHCTAAGKVILAHLPETEARTILDDIGMPQSTQSTVTDRRTLFEELKEICEQGYAFADEEQMKGMRAVGAPILDPNNEVVGCITISGPTSRLNGDFFRERLRNEVVSTANICEINLQILSIDGVRG